MKVVILRSVAGQFKGKAYAYQVGEAVAIPDELAADLVKAGHAKNAAPAATRKKRAAAKGADK